MTSKTGRYTKQGYIIVKTANGWKREHRVIWEEHHKASLLSWIHIHHKNGNRQDNRIENLEAMPKPNHSKIHFNPSNRKGKHHKWKSNANSLGRIFTEEHKQKIGNALRGKPKSQEHKDNIKKNHWARKYKKVVI